MASEKQSTNPSVQLFKGDCLSILPQLMPGAVQMVLTDLPFGMTANKWDSKISIASLWAEYDRLRVRVCVFNAMQPFTSLLINSRLSQFKYSWIWRKEMGTGMFNANRQPLRNHEDVLVFYQAQPVYNPQWREGNPYNAVRGRSSSNYREMPAGFVNKNDGWRFPVTVLDFNRDRHKEHPTQKPVALMEYLIKTYTHPGETVLDNCMGSGTTGVACVKTGRSFIGIEKDQDYFAIAKRRIKAARFK